MSLNLAIAPQQSDGGLDCPVIATETLGETPELENGAGFSLVEPGIYRQLARFMEQIPESLREGISMLEIRGTCAQLAAGLFLVRSQFGTWPHS